MKRYICAWLILCILLPTAAACTADPDVDIPTTELVETTLPIETEPVETTVLPQTTAAPETTALPEELPELKEEDGDVILMSDGVVKYTIVRARADSGGKALEISRSLAKEILKLCGKELPVVSDGISDTGLEILIGETNRPESAEVYKELSNVNYAVRRIGDKIVIAGKSEYALSLALRYFIDECVKESGNGYLSVTVAPDHIGADNGTVTIASGERANYSLVYTKDAADPYNYSYYDYTFDETSVMTDMLAELKKSVGVIFPKMADHVFDASKLSSTKEILVGRCDRTETEQVRAELGYNEYAIRVMGSKIVVTGLGFLSTYEAMGKFVELMQSFKTVEDGKTTIAIPSDFYYKGVYSNGKDWYTDIPKYEKGKLLSVSDLNDGGYMIEIGETSSSEYKRYLLTLQKSGYEKYTDNKIADNLFAVYKSKDCIIHAYFAPVYDKVKIIVEPADTPLFPLASEYKNIAVTTPKLIQLKISNETSTNGMCYIFRLSNGKFVVVDSGSEQKSADIIYEKLVEENMLPGKPVIAAWIFTHYHGDHYGAFTSRFVKNYLDKVEIESFVYGFPADVYVYNNGLFGSAVMSSGYANFKKATESATHYIPHAGDVMYFGDLKITFIYTQDEFLPHTFEFFNDSSLTFMVEVGKNDPEKILITGDASENSCNIMCEMYGSYLKCDILQVPHHGRFGGNYAFFDATDPQVALIPVESKRFDDQMTFVTELIYLLRKKNVREYYVSGKGTSQFDLPYLKY